jgi:acetyl esterase/lipase
MPLDLRVHLDVPVARVPTKIGARPLVADLWIPVRPEPVPCVIYIHGGGWKTGTQYRPPVQPRLFDDGVAVAAITYRFSTEALFPAMFEDCKTMVRWLRYRASRYGLDAERFATWGVSAGGNLASLLALTSGREDAEGSGDYRDHSSAVRAAVSWCGVGDFVRGLDDPNPGRDMRELTALLFGDPIDRALAHAASPAHQVGKGAPHLLVHGRQDDQVPAWHSESLHEKLRAAGAESHLLIDEHAGHTLGAPAHVEATRVFFLRHLLS